MTLDKEKLIGQVFLEIAEGIKTGSFKKKVRIGLTTLGSEHGEEELINAAKLAKQKYGNFEIVIIGTENLDGFECLRADSLEECHKVMLELLNNKRLDGCVTMHFDFPIGVSTVGKIVCPSSGKELILSTTTGTSDTDRVNAMVLNTISGIAAAKSQGIENPSVGILNIEGARSAEIILKKLSEKGYPITFGTSGRQDGGAVMRGNDLMAGSCSVMVCDSLTGNLLVKIFSSFISGGSYETMGAGYGPGISKDYDKLINIVSRASGAPLIAEALSYCAKCAENNILETAKSEFKKAEDAGLSKLLEKREIKEEIINKPEKKVVTYSIAGIDILELDNAVNSLWKENIYAESGMGCTGPVILVNENDGKLSDKILKDNGFKI